LAPPGAKTEAASPSRLRAQKQVVWSFEARRCPSRWNVRAQIFESCAWGSVARGEICGAGDESAAVLGDVVCDAGKVEAVAVEDEAVGIGVPGVGEEKSQWRIAPSESPRRGSGARGAMLGLFVGNDIRSWQAKKRKTHTKLLFCVHGGQPAPS
jgi:hypothetical protein